MDIQELLLGDYRDKKLLQLYLTLSHSDLQGNYEDTYTIELLYSVMCLDLAANTKMGLKLEPNELTLLARNVVRCVDDGELSKYSIFNWSMALLTYMKENNLKPKQINKENTFKLIENVEKYLDKGE